MEDLKAIRKRKFFIIRITILLVILAVCIVVALYQWLVYVPYMLENMDFFDEIREPLDLEGDGSVVNPYLIKTVEDLAELAGKVNAGSSYRDVHFLLENNLDMTDFLSPEGAGYNDGAGWETIGTYTGTAFSGIFDGAGHTISGLWINRPDESDVGLFGQIRGGGIYQLNVEATSIIGRINVGALAGNARNSTILLCSAKVEFLATDCERFSNAMGGLVGDLRSTLVENCSAVVTMEISPTQVTNFGGLTGIAIQNSRINNSSAIVDVAIDSDNFIVAGGLVGNVYGGSTIRDSRTEGSLSVKSSDTNIVGGLAGVLADVGGLIFNSSSECTVASTYIAGGLAGALRDGARITNSHASGNVSGAQWAGGFVGDLYGSGEITDSFATGNVICTNETEEACGCRLGGFVGWSAGTISRSFATGNIKMNSRCDYGGGFVALQNGGLIANCYSLGDVGDSFGLNGGFAGGQWSGEILNCYSAGKTRMYGFIPFQSGIIENSYYDFDTTGRTEFWGDEINELAARTTAEMQNRETFEGWDFINVWFMPEDGGYPQLRQIRQT